LAAFTTYMLSGDLQYCLKWANFEASEQAPRQINIVKTVA
jgi:hypothetical protein